MPRLISAPTARPSAGRVLVLLLIAAVGVIGVRALLVQSFVIPTSSMSPALKPEQRVLVWRLGRGVEDLRRGDVIVFDGTGVFVAEPPPARTALAGLGRSLAAVIGLPVGRSDFAKRVIGLPGERVTCCDADGRITVDGVPLEEPYLAARGPASESKFDIRVPEGRLWVMGDNRSDSADSRAHLGDPGGGTVPVDNVVGRVIAIWWPAGDLTRVSRGAGQEGTR
ncbi:MAG: signal peptidase I [Kineosporiaceae bacterium]|nr:signal peptidase I [Kineosporiaceae bacterium]